MEHKVKSAQALSRILSGLRSRDKKIVFTNGCFDILHAGHVEYLKMARELGDILVVGINSDASVRSIKGASRPINAQADRAKIVASLYFVDFAVIFNENTPERLIKVLRPDVLAKGGDWKLKDIVGGDFVKAHGGRVVSVPFLKGYSTTSLIKKMSK
ncbi:MAG: D-glycero-beta-D-manno-heptose 1-phosphate adenylyltransferase [Candidatus Omnitrophota bacterium]|nr:D-glycero-beta-D-manno-heptose 1-phosphate adenylyltransferase [Candidatus Omnitrophota bacterium]